MFLLVNSVVSGEADQSALIKIVCPLLAIIDKYGVLISHWIWL